MQKAKKIHGQPEPVNIPNDAQESPPIPCGFTVGDVVTYTNDNGVSFKNHIITGFAPRVESWGGFIYLAKDAWWFPVPASSLKKEKVA